MDFPAGGIRKALFDIFVFCSPDVESKIGYAESVISTKWKKPKESKTKQIDSRQWHFCSVILNYVLPPTGGFFNFAV